MKLPDIQKMIVPAVALAVGLIIGLGLGYLKLQSEQKIFHGKIADANKKLAFMQKKLAEEKNETVASVQQQCQANMDNLQKEKGALAAQLGTSRAQIKTLEAKNNENADLAARTKKELHALEGKYAGQVQQNKEMDGSLKKVTGEKQTFQAELKKRDKELGECKTNNTRLVIIADDLLKKYRNKGLGTVLLQNEPLTQIKKVELEQITQQYRNEIEQQKINKK